MHARIMILIPKTRRSVLLQSITLTSFCPVMCCKLQHVDLGKVSSTAFVSDKFVERALTRPVVMIDRNLLRRQLPVVLIRQILSNDENHQFYVVKMVQNSSLEHRGQHFIFRNHDHKSKNAIKRSWRGSAVVVRIVGIHNWNCAAS